MILATRRKKAIGFLGFINKRTNPLLIIIIWLVSINFLYLHYAHNSLWITIYLNPPKPELIVTNEFAKSHVHAKKIAFLFLTLDNIHTPKVWHTFFENESDKQYYNIYVHPKWPSNVTTDQPYICNNILPSHLLINNTQRFSYSLVDASNTMFKYALNDKLNQKFVLLSETTIPLYNFRTIYDKLMYNNNNLSWGLQEGTEGKQKCFRDIYNGIKMHGMSELNMTEIEFEQQFIPRNICLHTTQWIVLDRSIIENYLLKYEQYWAQFYRGVNESFADEDYYSNMMVKFMKSDYERKSIEPKSVTYYWYNPIDWTHAAYFDHVGNKWIDKLRSEGYLFLRKVNESSIVDVNYLLQ